jgi:hypothetical protein
MRRWLNEGDSAGEYRKEKRRVKETLAARRRSRNRRHWRSRGAGKRHVSSGDQYAFSALSRANGVRATMKRSNSTDQFSM